MKRVDQLFPEILRKQPQKQIPVEEVVRSAWARLAGPQIAARTVVFRLYRETLIVHVPDRTWKQQLHRLEAQLLERINRLLGSPMVTGIDFRVDQTLVAVASDGHPPKKGPARELPAGTEAELEASARAIADPELRQLFLRTARKMIR